MSAEPNPAAPAAAPPGLIPIAHLEAKALLLLALLGLLLLASVGYLLYARGVFEQTQELVLVSDDAEGVRVGMDLTFSGFPVGRVRRIDLAADGKARLFIDVPHKDAAWLRSSSVFTLERGLVGDTRLRAFSGNLADPPLPDQALRTVLRGDSTEDIPRMIASARALLANLEAISGADSNLNASLEHLKTASSRLNGKYGALSLLLGDDQHARKLLGALDRSNALLDRGSALLARSDTLLNNANQKLFGPNGLSDQSAAALAQISSQATGLLSEARSSLKNVDALLQKAQAIASHTEAASVDLVALRAEVERSLRRLDYLVGEINRKWPLARDTEIKLP